jgi:hypothetical protein
VRRHRSKVGFDAGAPIVCQAANQSCPEMRHPEGEVSLADSRFVRELDSDGFVRQGMGDAP